MPAAEASTAQEMVERVNEARWAHGVRKVGLSQRLQRSAADYSWWMLDMAYFGHSGSIRASRRFGFLGEVLAQTDQEHPSADDIVRQWLASPSHRAVVLSPRFRFIGVGIARGWLGDLPTTLVTAHLGALKRRHSASGHWHPTADNR